MAERVIIGVDLGGTHVQVGVVDPDGRVLARTTRETHPGGDRAGGARDVVDRIAAAAGEVCAEVGVSSGDAACCGIGAPGPIDAATGSVIEAPNLRWRDVPLAAMLGEKLGVPVTVENDVNAGVWGEFVRGAGRGACDVLGAWVGTGIGGGLVLGGKLHRGHAGSAGEIGQMVVAPRNPPGLRRLEHLYSRTALCHRARRMIEANEPSVLSELTGGDLAAIDTALLARAYGEGDELVVGLIDDAAEGIGSALGGLATALGLDTIVLGGGLTEAIGAPFVERVTETVRAGVFPDRLRTIAVRVTELEHDAGLIGAAMLAGEAAGIAG